MTTYESTAGGESDTQLYDCLQAGRIPDSFLYMGDEGAKNWLRLERSEEHRSAGNINALLWKCAHSLRRFVAPGIPVVSIGVGSGEMERVVLENLADSIRIYYAVGPSGRLVDVALSAVQDPRVVKRGVVGRFEDLPALRGAWGSPVLCCVLGGLFSRMEPEGFFGTVSGSVSPEDTVLFDSRLFPRSLGREAVRERMERSFRSGRIAGFHLAPLIQWGLHPENCELHFEFAPVSTESGVAYRAQRSIHLREDCTLSCGSRQLSFRGGDVLDFGSTFLFRRDQVETLVHQNGFTILDLHEDSDAGNLIVHARKRE